MRKLLWVLGGGAGGFVIAVLVMRFALTTGGDTTIRLATSAPPIPVVSEGATAASSAATIDSAPSAKTPDEEAVAPSVAAGPDSPVASPPATTLADGSFRFKADPAQSSTKILVTQTGVLGNMLLPANGSNVTGEIVLTNDGRLGDAPSAFQLDLRTLRSNDAELTSFLKNDLEAAKYPYGQFVIASTSGIPATYADGTEFTFTMTGPLTMHGRTKFITWTARARHAGEFLTFAADADFLMTDYGWTPPNYGVAWVKNSVHIQVTVIARKDVSGGEQVPIVTPASSTSKTVAPAAAAPSLASPPLASESPILSSPATGTPGLGGDIFAGQSSASSLTSLLNILGPLLGGTSNASGLPAFNVEDLMTMLLGGSGNSSLGSGR